MLLSLLYCFGSEVPFLSVFLVVVVVAILVGHFVIYSFAFLYWRRRRPSSVMNGIRFLLDVSSLCRSTDSLLFSSGYVSMLLYSLLVAFVVGGVFFSHWRIIAHSRSVGGVFWLPSLIVRLSRNRIRVLVSALNASRRPNASSRLLSLSLSLLVSLLFLSSSIQGARKLECN